MHCLAGVKTSPPALATPAEIVVVAYITLLLMTKPPIPLVILANAGMTSRADATYLFENAAVILVVALLPNHNSSVN